MQKIVFGGGCFWCTEAVFKRIPGVSKVVSGYSGGHMDEPTYRDVSDGTTGHAEVIEVTFDEKKVSLQYILDVFFKTHDPTTIDQQGNDIGTQYRSIILYADDAQKKESLEAIKRAQKDHDEKVVTEVKKLERFYPAENYHQNYYDSNKSQSYCKLVILPKVQKVEELIKETSKKNN